jgi:hypothetical protein
VITGHLHESPPPLPPSVPQAAAELVDWAMAKDPADRPASAGMFARECRVAVAQARPVAREPNRTTVDLLVSSSPPPRPTAAMPPGAVPPAAGHGAADAERPRRKRGRGVLLGLAAVVAAVGLTIGVMQFLDEDEPDGRSAGEDPSGGPTSADATATDAATETTSPEEVGEPEVPAASILVNAESGDCLIGYFDTPPPSARMDPCDGNGIDEFAIADSGDGVRFEHTYEASGGEDATMCVVWDGEIMNFSESCDGPVFEFEYLRTDEAEEADFWKVRAVGGGNYCLDVSDEPVTPEGAYAPVLNPCSEGDIGQQWRTAAL